MKLSEIDTSVYYPFVIPSTQKKTKFRPFVVKEEKALLIAQESEDQTTMINTLESIVRSCVVNCPSALTTFDIEYAFLQIRAKSVGEEAYVVCTCTKCSTKNNVVLDITKSKVVGLEQEKKLKLSDKLVVIMKYPSVSDLSNLLTLNQTDQSVAAIAASIETIYYKDSVFHSAESDAKEMEAFLLNRSDDEISKLVNFVENTPKVIVNAEYECKQCATVNNLKIESIADFF